MKKLSGNKTAKVFYRYSKFLRQLCGKTDDGKICRRINDSDDEGEEDIKPGPSHVAQVGYYVVSST